MYYKSCEVCGLKAGRVNNQKRIFMAKFPLNPERCKKWVQWVGKEDLAYLPIEKLHMLRHVCINHFKPRDFKKKKTQLRKTAVPSVAPRGPPLSDELLIDFPLHISKDNIKKKPDQNSNVTWEHNYLNPDFSQAMSSLSQVPNNSPVVTPVEHMYKMEPSIEVTVNKFDYEATQYDNVNEMDSDKPSAPPMEVPVGQEEFIVPDDGGMFSWQQKSEPVEMVEDKSSNGVFQCVICKEDIIGCRYTCVQCNELDLCSGCESRGEHDHHYVLRIPALRPLDEVEEILSRVRKYFTKKPDPGVEKTVINNDTISVKSEIKSEDESEYYQNDEYKVDVHEDNHMDLFDTQHIDTSHNISQMRQIQSSQLSTLSKVVLPQRTFKELNLVQKKVEKQKPMHLRLEPGDVNRNDSTKADNIFKMEGPPKVQATTVFAEPPMRSLKLPTELFPKIKQTVTSNGQKTSGADKMS